VFEGPFANARNADFACPARRGKPWVITGWDDGDLLFYTLDPLAGKGDLLGKIQSPRTGPSDGPFLETLRKSPSLITATTTESKSSISPPSRGVRSRFNQDGAIFSPSAGLQTGMVSFLPRCCLRPRTYFTLPCQVVCSSC
jgi:hypothetical protein